MSPDIAFAAGLTREQRIARLAWDPSACQLKLVATWNLCGAAAPRVLSAATISMEGVLVTAMRVGDVATIDVVVEVAKARLSWRCVLVLAGGGDEGVRIIQPRPFSAGDQGLYTTSMRLPRTLFPEAVYSARAGAWLKAEDARASIMRRSAFTVDLHRASDLDESPDRRLEPATIDHLPWPAWTGGRVG